MTIRTELHTGNSDSVRSNSVTEGKICARAVVAEHCNDFTGPLVKYTLEYSFGVQGGAVAALTLRDADPLNNINPETSVLQLPAGFIVLRAWVIAKTTATSGGSATIKLGITGNDDAFVAATAYSNAAFVAGAVTALTAEVPLTVGAAPVSVLATVATAALTAGRFFVVVEGMPSVV